MRTILALVLLSSATLAQTPTTEELRGAMQSCNLHQKPPPSLPPGISMGVRDPVYQTGWEHCSGILAELRQRDADLRSEEARQATKALSDKLKGPGP